MPDLNNLKESLFNQIIAIIDERIEFAKIGIQSAKESRDNETKSSVGDKYETGRVMMQMELDKNRLLLNKALSLKNELEHIDLHKKHETIDFGSLAITTNGNYFISIGIGKLKVENETYYSISLASPVGKILQGKKVNDKVVFQGNEITILEIV